MLNKANTGVVRELNELREQSEELKISLLYLRMEICANDIEKAQKLIELKSLDIKILRRNVKKHLTTLSSDLTTTRFNLHLEQIDTLIEQKKTLRKHIKTNEKNIKHLIHSTKRSREFYV